MNINVTENGSKELRKVLEGKDTNNKGLRLYIAGFGWGGPTFGLALDEQKDNDIIEEVDGFKFIADKDVTSQYNKFTVDFVKDWLRKGFRIYADNASSC